MARYSDYSKVPQKKLASWAMHCCTADAPIGVRRSQASAALRSPDVCRGQYVDFDEVGSLNS